ncbi:MAG: hypothetical protein H6Q58_1461, partial [Firmicutes bacterium]|nr:hypothetical protein [Bacillota bacterium]
RPYFNAVRNKEKTEQIETVGEELRKMMPWVKKRK